MPTTATELLKKMLAKAGVVYDGDLSADIPDEVATSLDNQLLTIAAATNNHPLVKKHYYGVAYSGLEKEIQNLMVELDLPEEAIGEIMRASTFERPDGSQSGVSSTKRVIALVRKVKELGEKALPVGDKDAAAKHAAAVKDLNDKLAAEIAKQNQLKADFENKVKQIEVRTKLQSILSGYKTVFDDLDPAAKEAGIQALITKSLQDSNADFTFDEKGNLSLVTKDGTNLFGDNHTVVTPHSFIDKTLSKILKVTEAPKPNNPAQPVPGGQHAKNGALDAALDEAEQAYKAGSKQAVVV